MRPMGSLSLQADGTQKSGRSLFFVMISTDTQPQMKSTRPISNVVENIVLTGVEVVEARLVYRPTPVFYRLIEVS